MKRESQEVFTFIAALFWSAVAIIIVGCVDVSTYGFDREHFRNRLNEQSHRIYEIEKDMTAMRRGYVVVPATITITNTWEAADERY